MNNMLETIYKYVYIAGYPINAVAIIIYLLGNNQSVSYWFPLIVFGIVTLIVFLFGRLVQERFDNTLQFYLLAVSGMYLIAAFIGPYDPWYFTFFKAITAVGIFAAAFFLDDLFEAE